MTAHPRRGAPPTRVGRTWVGLALGLLVLVLVLVFILENLQSVKVTFFGATGRVPLAVGLLLAAVLGGLTVVLIGTARIVQLRRHARRVRREAEVSGAPEAGPEGQPATTTDAGGTDSAPGAPVDGTSAVDPAPGAPVDGTSAVDPAGSRPVQGTRSA